MGSLPGKPFAPEVLLSAVITITSHMTKGIAFAGSSLPALLMVEQIKSGAIAEIYVSHSKFISTYEIVSRRSGLEIPVRNLGSPALSRRIWLAFRVMLLAKLSRSRVFMYHECCWPLVDFFVWLLRPSGFHFPQVDVRYMFRPVSRARFVLRHLSIFGAVKHFALLPLFRYFYDIDNKQVVQIHIAMRAYPATIVAVDTSTPACRVQQPLALKKKIIIFCGTDYASPEELTCIYETVSRRASSLGYEVYVKNHPNPEARLPIVLKGAHEIDPTVPAELLEDDFSLAIGTASASMRSYGRRAVSVLRLVSSMDEQVRDLRLSFIYSVNPSVCVPSSLSELFAKIPSEPTG